MTDLHCHILPGMDDGAKDTACLLYTSPLSVTATAMCRALTLLQRSWAPTLTSTTSTAASSTAVSYTHLDVYKRQGVDICAAAGTPIYASAGGTVTKAGYTRTGNSIIISHGNGYTTLYAHCLSLVVHAGQSVKMCIRDRIRTPAALYWRPKTPTPRRCWRAG